MPGVTLEEARLFTDPARGEVDMVFQFEHVNLDQGATKWDVKGLRLTDLKASFGRWQEGLQETGWNSLYWNNHDQPRVVSRFGDDGPEHRVRSAKMLATVLHLHRGTPYVYQGEEIGMTNARFDRVEAFRDIESLNHYAEAVASGEDPDAVLAGLRTMGRDNARTPMQWDAGEHAGFTTGEPWIPVNPNHDEINAEAAVADPDSVFHHYRRLIELRHSEPVVAHGDFTMLLPDDERVYAFTRGSATTSCSCSATSPATTRRSSCPTPAASSCSATTATRARTCCARGRRGCCGDDRHAPRPGARARAPAEGAPRAALMLGHGAGGGIKARDLQAVAAAARELGFMVALVEQPYVVAGRRTPAPAHQLDTAWLAVVEHLRARRASARDRRALLGRARRLPHCRGGGRGRGAVPRVPRHPPGKPEKTRLDELDGVEVPVLVVQGERDPFGCRRGAGREVVVVPGTHSFAAAGSRGSPRP